MKRQFYQEAVLSIMGIPVFAGNRFALKSNKFIKTIKTLFLAFFFIFSVWSSTAQIWSEDFTYPDGTTVGTGNKWTISGSPTGSRYFEVRSNSFRGNNLDAEYSWLSESINISGYTAVSISIDAGEIGIMEGSDYILFQYRLNGGSWITFASEYDDFGSGTYTVSGLSGSTLEIRVIFRNSSTAETHWIDNVTVTDGLIYCTSYGNTSYQTSVTLVDFNTINNSSGKPSGYSD
ncbi:MAG: hypothetical protein GXO81_05100, partial [Chlorobi bacterium]|nr:hypothetical protein [Chlorobiota bacterium]